MLLSKTVIHAIYTLCYLSMQDRSLLISAGTIADAVNVPREHERKILSLLRDAGLIVSVRGRDGGFVSARSLSDITVLQIVEAMSSRNDRDGESYRVCPLNRADGCKVRCGVTRLQSQMRTLLSNTTLSEVVGSKCDGHRRIIGSDLCTGCDVTDNGNYLLA